MMNPEATPQLNTDQRIEKLEEKIVDVVEISASFDDEKALEKIADHLLSRGLISGHSIVPAKIGYLYKGDKVETQGSRLTILLPSGSVDQGEILNYIKEEIEKKWDVADIEVRQIKTTEKMLNFINRIKIEHAKFKKERTLKLSLATAALLGLATIVGTLIEKYSQSKAETARMEEQAKTLSDLWRLSDEVRFKIDEINDTIHDKIPREVNPFTQETTEFGGNSYKETQEIKNSLNELTFKLVKIVGDKGVERAREILNEKQNTQKPQ